MASYCQLCGLPTQHDHYLPCEGKDFWKIYRSSQPGLPSAVDFGPQHDWLNRAVALDIYGEQAPAFGPVEDGHLVEENGEFHFVGEGQDDRAILHQVCWEMLGSPARFEEISCAPYLHDRILLGRYQRQLFEFGTFVSEGRGDWLLDPNRPEGAASRQRLLKLVREVERVQALEPARSASQLACSNCWSRADQPDGFWRYRDQFSADLDLEGRDWKQLCVIHAFEGEADGPHSLRLERFESELLATLTDLGIVLICRGETDQWSHLIYTDRPDQCQAAILALEPNCEFDLHAEPDWKTYLKKLHPLLAGRWEA